MTKNSTKQINELSLILKQSFAWNKARGESLVIKQPRAMTGVSIYLSALRLDEGKLLMIASSKPCENAIEVYAKRWQIETLFAGRIAQVNGNMRNSIKSK
jgi:hypothetical protein